MPPGGIVTDSSLTWRISNSRNSRNSRGILSPDSPHDGMLFLVTTFESESTFDAAFMFLNVVAETPGIDPSPLFGNGFDGSL